MMATIKSLLDLLDKFTPEVRKAFFEAIQDIKDTAVISKVIEAINRGDITAAIKALGLEPAAFRPLVRAVENAFEAGGIFVVSQFPRQVTGAIFRFDVRNSSAEAWLRDYSSQLVTRITAEQVSIVQTILQEGVAQGIGPRNLALDLIGRIDAATGSRVGGVIGLNRPQAMALQKARTELTNLDANYLTRELRDKRFDSIVQKAIDSGNPLTQEQIDQLTTRYSDSLLKWRGETIARTETIASLNQAQQESVNQIVESGAVERSDVRRIWDATDNIKGLRTRDSHVDMDGQEVGADEPFISPSGARLMYPGDTSLGASGEETINCRCRLKLKIDWIGAAKRNE